MATAIESLQAWCSAKLGRLSSTRLLAIKAVGASLAISALVASCNKPSAQSVEWYKAHDAERQATLEQCRVSGDSAKTDDNCRNAAEAEFLSGSYTPSPDRKW